MHSIYKQLEQMEQTLKGMEMGDIDPIAFGMLQADVSNLKGQVSSIAGKVDALFEMANKGKGGLWMFNSGLVFAGGLFAWAVDHFSRVFR